MRRRLVVLVLVVAVASAAGVVAALGGGPDKRGATVVRLDVHSRLVGRDLRQLAVVPSGAADGPRRPLLLWLHGRSGHPGDFFSDRFYAELQRLGSRAPVVVAVNGARDSYYHDRRSGRWGSYVMREVLPAALKSLPVDPHRVAIGGISMGGFGALDIARRNPGRFCAAGGHSPAIWTTGGETAPGAFDDAEDFARHDLVRYAGRARRPWGSIPLWLDRGNQDWFVRGDSAFVSALRHNGRKISTRRWPGRHNGAYWTAHTGDYLRFYVRAFKACRGRTGRSGR